MDVRDRFRLRPAGGHRRRRGAAVVEMAVVTPLLLLMIFGIMEFGWLLMLRESLTNAVRESARVRVLRGSTDADARARFTTAVSGTNLNVTSDQLTITSATQTNGDVIWTVTATVPRSQLSLFGLSNTLQRLMQFFNPSAGMANTNIVTSCSMRQEG